MGGFRLFGEPKPILIFEIIGKGVCVSVRKYPEVRLERLFDGFVRYGPLFVLANAPKKFFEYPFLCFCTKLPIMR